MTGTEGTLISVVVGLVGLGGGVWAGAKGKVSASECAERHQQLTADRGEIKKAIQDGFRELRDEIKDSFCQLQAEDRALHGRLTDHETRISFMEGGKKS